MPQPIMPLPQACCALLAAAPRLAGRRRLLSSLLAPLATRLRSCKGGEEEAAGSGGVLRHLLLKLRATGPVTVAEYMREALTNPGQVRRGRAGAEPSAAALRCSSPPLAGLLHAAGRCRRGLHHLAGDQPDIWRGDAQSQCPAFPLSEV